MMILAANRESLPALLKERTGGVGIVGTGEGPAVSPSTAPCMLIGNRGEEVGRDHWPGLPASAASQQDYVTTAR